MKSFNVGQPVKFREGHQYEGKIGVVHASHDDGSIQVRILKGQDGAGRIISAYSEGVEEYEVPKREEPQPEQPEENRIVSHFRGNWQAYLAGLAVSAILVVSMLRNPHVPEQESKQLDPHEVFINVQISELNRLNSEDASDLAAKTAAEERMAERKRKKDEILRILYR